MSFIPNLTAPPSFRLEPRSLRELIQEADSLLLFGIGRAWRECRVIFQRLTEQTVHPSTSLKTIYDWQMAPASEAGNQPGACVENMIKRQCKRTFVKFAFSAWKSENEGSKPLQLFFIVHSNLNRDEPPVCSETILSRTKRVFDHASGQMMCSNQQPRNSEFRRLYKLFHDERVDPEIRAAVQKNTIFASLKVDTVRSKGSFEKTEAPWEDPSWESEWEKRKQGRRVQGAKQYDWRQELNSMAQKSLLTKLYNERIAVCVLGYCTD